MGLRTNHISPPPAAEPVLANDRQDFYWLGAAVAPPFFFTEDLTDSLLRGNAAR